MSDKRYKAKTGMKIKTYVLTLLYETCIGNILKLMWVNSIILNILYDLMLIKTGSTSRGLVT